MIPENVANLIAQFHDTYRHPNLGPLEVSGLYALFPNEGGSVAVDYRWPDPWPRGSEPGVYLVFGEDLEVSYIGMSRKVAARLDSWFWYADGPGSDCRLRHNWKVKPAYVATVGLKEAFEAPALEGYLIEKLNPPDNTRGLRVEEFKSTTPDPIPSDSAAPLD